MDLSSRSPASWKQRLVCNVPHVEPNDVGTTVPITQSDCKGMLSDHETDCSAGGGLASSALGLSKATRAAITSCITLVGTLPATVQSAQSCPLGKPAAYASCTAADSTASSRCAARACTSGCPGASAGMPRASAMNEAATQPQAPAAARPSPACSAATNAPQKALPQPAPSPTHGLGLHIGWLLQVTKEEGQGPGANCLGMAAPSNEHSSFKQRNTASPEE